MLVRRIMSTPIAKLQLIADDDALIGVHFESFHRAPVVEADEVGSHPVLDWAERELAEYFRGERRRFDVPLVAHGTPFQRAVWDALAALPYGAAVSYAALAAQVGRPRAVRAVGTANGANPFAIIWPCHRVIASDGSLGGYGGGLDAKRWLLAHEARWRTRREG